MRGEGEALNQGVRLHRLCLESGEGESGGRRGRWVWIEWVKEAESLQGEGEKRWSRE